MSADNFIVIDKKTFKVYEGCASTGEKWQIGKGKNLKDAVKIAEDYLETNGGYLEYGIFFKGGEKVWSKRFQKKGF